MSLIFRKPPHETWEALLAGRTFLRPGDPSLRDMANAPLAQPVYTLGLRQIAGGDELGAASPTSWRFVARGESGQFVAAEVSARLGVAPKMTGLWRGRQIENVVRAVEDVTALEELRAADYELRVLRIPALRTEAIWLKAPDDANDRMVPFLTLARELESMKPYSAGDFLTIARRMAAKQLELEAAAERGESGERGE
jgi:hypothetical protein